VVFGKNKHKITFFITCYSNLNIFSCEFGRSDHKGLLPSVSSVPPGSKAK
jgi:hypothetical protein